MAFCAKPPTPGSTYHSSIDLELTISIRNVLDNELWSKSDPVCVLFNLPFKREWQEYGRTKLMAAHHHYSGKLKVKYCFEERQPLKLYFYDSEASSRLHNKHGYLGRVSCTLAQIVAFRTQEIPLMLDGVQQGQLIISAHQIGSKNQEELELSFVTSKFKKRGLPFSQQLDHFLDIVGSNGMIIRRSRCLTNSKNPNWPHLSLPFRVLRNERGELGSLTLRCYNYKEDDDHQLIGETVIQAKQLQNAPATILLKKNGSDKGEVQLTAASMKRVYSFPEYVSAGVQLHSTFAFDLHVSNGDPRKPGSLHHLGSEPTMYESVMKTFGEILQDYSNDQVLSLLGFGARFTPISHELRVTGIDSILQAYRTCLETVQLGESTRTFAAPIEHVMRTAKTQIKAGHYYFLLLILTDGDVADVKQLAKVIADASQLPISILFVGIGNNGVDNINNSFPNLSLLNGDVRRLGLDVHADIRDNVRFAPFSDFLSIHRDINGASFHLVKHLLADVPDHLATFMRLSGVVPNANESTNVCNNSPSPISLSKLRLTDSL